MDNIRKIKVSVQSSSTFEGAGVRLKRAFGYADESLDPFLLLDDFHSDDPRDYIKGFPGICISIILYYHISSSYIKLQK